MRSVWSETARLPSFAPLQGDIRTDVLVVGGGIAGILCAYLLTQAGVDTVLVEAKKLCSGVTGNTTAKITAQHGLVYHKLLRRFGEEKTKQYLLANQAALERYRELCQTIDCDFQTRDSFIYSRDDEALLEEELEALRRLGYGAQLARKLPLPFDVAGAVYFPRQAQFHPLKFLSAVAAGLPIYENTKVLELAPGWARTDRGVIRAEKIIVATHFPILNKHGSYFLKQYQQRSYVLALENAPQLDGIYLDAQEGGLSLRSAGKLLLLGGCGHRTGKQTGGWSALSGLAHRYYPQAREVCRWATQDCMTLDGVPYIGRYSKRTPDLFVATGFGKWGMTSAMAAAMVLTDLVQGRENPFAPVFSPSRSILRPQLALNGFEAVKNLLTPGSPRCPHLGCKLKWNEQEHSWDCPCHGSRFTTDGQLLDNPSTGDIKKRPS
ncbi:MAG: FAD-dependent oxidoreductase [Firmicutes bacterium]|nr:FAD-dependent oxidoreductase [Bacillota bacterium]MDY2719895.1 FAD-dependent oxidoreductase [Candidatus Faecousia sp.]